METAMVSAILFFALAFRLDFLALVREAGGAAEAADIGGGPATFRTGRFGPIGLVLNILNGCPFRLTTLGSPLAVPGENMPKTDLPRAFACVNPRR
eukprot:m.266507 g.266507  ORF g.266507 m.266507 type:complete len:96 (-) comp16036_c0_seq30:3532-3819(-)